MRPERIPHFPHAQAGWAVCGLLVVVGLGCSAGDSGPTGITEGAALGKFCHDLHRGGLPVTLTLQLGDPAILSITAKTRVCAPLAGTPCATIPVGRVPVKLLEGDKVLSTRSVILLKPVDGMPLNEYVFEATINNANTQAVVTGGRIAPGTCQALDFPPPDGGVRDGSVGEGGAGEAGATDGPAPDAGVADVAVSPDLAEDLAVPVDVATPDAPEDAPAPTADTAPDSVTD